MGYEYRITVQVPAEELEPFLERFRREFPASEEGEDFTLTAEPEGFYFCDHIKSERSTRAFRWLIDWALAYSARVVIEEP